MKVIVQINNAMLNSTIYIYEEKWCVIIDPANPETCSEMLQKNSWTPVAVLLTHSHFDHITGLKYLLTVNPSLPIYIHPKEKENLFTPEGNLSSLTGSYFSISRESNVINVTDDSNIIIQPSESSISFKFHAYYVPGHSIGSIMYEFTSQDKNNKNTTYLSTGDFLFEDTVGRNDLPGGSSRDMQTSLAAFKKRYSPRKEENILIIPGHASSTTSPVISLKKELENNPFLTTFH